jgi:cbb3-type cytochrome oxidase maturation protein
MQVILILMICSMALAGGFLLAFIWADRTGQFDDDVSPAHRILFDQKKQKNDQNP